MITIFVDNELRQPGEISLPESGAQHVRVRRAAAGDPIRLVNGRGSVGTGAIVSAGKRDVTVRVNATESVTQPSALIALVPVADRDRMLWAAEKCVELQVTQWQPVVYARSRSVSPRGEGEKFAEKVRLRMQAALEQSGGAWIPTVNPELDAADAWKRIEAGTRLILDRDGRAPATIRRDPVAFAVGPEGGFENDEVEDALRHGWNPVSLGSTTLRFETAIVAAAAVIRAMQL